jgi:nicotinate-nucleotide--dimethylbenzimidazole phosphoribosyltransferase
LGRLVPADASAAMAAREQQASLTKPAGALGRLESLGLLDLGLRLGEGRGACLALPCVRTAAGILSSMATFGDAGVAVLDG